MYQVVVCPIVEASMQVEVYPTTNENEHHGKHWLESSDSHAAAESTTIDIAASLWVNGWFEQGHDNDSNSLVERAPVRQCRGCERDSRCRLSKIGFV